MVQIPRDQDAGIGQSLHPLGIMLNSNTSGLVKDKHARLLKPLRCTPLISKQKEAVSFMDVER